LPGIRRARHAMSTARATVEIITGRERRRRWSVADKLRILAKCDGPGVQVAEVAARHGLYRSLVF
jgi:transposase